MFSSCIEMCLLLIMVGIQDSPSPRFSTVKPPDVPVYSQSYTESALVKTLHQGDRVIVEFEITSGQSWCRIREADQTKTLGYVLCAQLDRRDQGAQTKWASPSPKPPGAAGGATPPPRLTTDPAAASKALRGSAADPDFWADRLVFRDDQRKRSADLMQNSGLAGCRARMEAMFRANGISDPASLLGALSGMGKSASGMAESGRIGAELDRCGRIYDSFWKRYLEILDATQKEQVAKDPPLLMFLLRVGSDPAVEFGMYVLSHAKER